MREKLYTNGIIPINESLSYYSIIIIGYHYANSTMRVTAVSK